MTLPQLSRHPQIQGLSSHDGAIPPRMVEYGYYAALFYAMIAPGLGIQIPLFSGGLLLILAAVCVKKAGARATVVFAPLKLPFACVLSLLMLDVVVHDAPIWSSLSRAMITWILTVTIVHSLSLRRDFFHRCVFVLLVIGLSTLPYLIARGVEPGRERLAVDSTTFTGDLSNSNGLGSWFGFCCLYFGVVAIESKRLAVRVASWLAFVGCLFVVGLTVSRGSLLGTALGLTIILRRVLKRGFVPLLLLVILLGISYVSGVFDDVLLRYMTRGAEDTGRYEVWPLAIQRFLGSPFLGVGSMNVGTWTNHAMATVAPHNSFIWFALTSGVLPFALFVAWWIRMFRNALPSSGQPADAAFRLPLLMYTLVNALLGDLGFMVPWGVIALSASMPPNNIRYGVRRLVLRTPGKHSTAEARGHSV